MSIRRLCIALLLSGLAISATAKDKKETKKEDKKKWDVNNPGGPGHDVSFTVNEGTWMNLDVSPDGRDIVFDLLGDIYIMPFAGGETKVLRQGMAMEVQPRFSPDGKKILFTSDAGGGDNIWTMNRDGSNAKLSGGIIHSCPHDVLLGSGVEYNGWTLYHKGTVNSEYHVS